MDNTNKAIARRINKELRIREWSRADLLRSIIKFKRPNISKAELRAEVMKRKGNFSTTLNGNSDRSIPKEDLYIISKIFELPLEYIWFGDEKKSGFIPNGARYVAYQDSESEYSSYIAGLEHEDKIQYPDENGFNLFDYFGQFDSINGYRFFVKNYELQFDYVRYHQLIYINGEGYPQFCSLHDRHHLVSDNLIMILAKYNDVKSFKKIYFDNCSLERFNSDRSYHQDKRLFSDYFLETLLNNGLFFPLILKTSVIDISIFNKNYDKGSIRNFVEPMFFEALSFALKHEKDFEDQLSRMLNFVLEFSKLQYEFIKNYLKNHTDERSDVFIDQFDSRCLRSSKNILMGNVFVLRDEILDGSLSNLLKEIEQYTFNMTHIINEQEKNNEEIKISTPDNPLFTELVKNAREQNINFVPMVIHADKDFTYFRFYESASINFNNVENLQFIIDCLNKSQNLVTTKANKILVHGNLNNAMLMVESGKVVGLSGWQKCYYGNKYEDRATLLSNIECYSYRDEYLKKYNDLFDIISQGFNKEEKIALIDKAIDILNERRKLIIKEDDKNLFKVCELKEQSSKLELFKELYLSK